LAKHHVRVVAWGILLIAVVVLPVFQILSPDPQNNPTEEQLLQDAEQRILQIRRGNITLDFGVGNASRTLYIHQLTQAFPFGCDVFGFDEMGNSTIDQLYAQDWAALFNFATVPLYWIYYEPNQGEYPNDTYLHSIISWLESVNATPKGHPIIWQNPPYVPQWMASLNQTQQRAAALAHIDQVLNDFPDVSTFDLLNEMTHQPNTWLGNTDVQTWEAALVEAQRVRPSATFIANEWDYGDTGASTAPNPVTDPYYQFLSQVSADGYAPSAMGLQFHCLQTWYPVEGILSALDTYGQLRIPIDITEFLPCSKGIYNGGIYQGVMTKETQAEYAVRTYITLFSHPAVHAITWWDFANTAFYSQNGWDDAWQGPIGGYLMDSSGRLLPAYYEIYNLIHVTWNSTTSVQLDATGSARFTGFYGSYSASFDNVTTYNFNITDTTPITQQPFTLQEL